MKTTFERTAEATTLEFRSRTTRLTSRSNQIRITRRLDKDNTSAGQCALNSNRITRVINCCETHLELFTAQHCSFIKNENFFSDHPIVPALCIPSQNRENGKLYPSSFHDITDVSCRSLIVRIIPSLPNICCRPKQKHNGLLSMHKYSRKRRASS